jgi:hypothetical protein
MKYASLSTVLAIGLAMAGCGGESGGTSPGGAAVTPPPVPPPPPPPPAAPSSTEREINPAVTDATITINLSSHIAINPNPAVPAKGRLFVMLPGTGGIPRFYRLILRTGAPLGYHTIGLTYPNDTTIGSLCAGSAVADCVGLARNEVITGADTSPVVNVNRANSITGRLISLLTYLNTTYPNEGWGQYLFGGQPNWALITVAGHSQGSGHAAYLAKQQNLDRMVMFSGPSDTGIMPGSQAPWLSLPNVTPASRQYGFTHTGDTLVPLALVSRNWDVIGLAAFGAAASVDGATSPFGNAHKLTTNLAPNPNPPSPVPDPEHSAPVLDAVTPLTATGTPAYAPVWIHVAFP